jgi:hypothetical protein
MVYKRYTTQNTPGDDRLALRRHKAFWMALAGGAAAAIVLGLVLTQTLRPAVESDRTAANTSAESRTPEPAQAPPTPVPLATASPRMVSPRPSPRPSPSESVAAEPGRFTNADLERMKREGTIPPPASPAPRVSPAPTRPSPSASPPARTAASPAAAAASPRAPSPPPATVRPGPSPDQPGEAGADNDEAAWRARTQRRVAAVHAAEGRLRQAQERVSTLREHTTAALAEGADRAADLQQQLQQAEDRLDQAEKDLQRAEQALDRLDEEARRAGVPAAWVHRPQ